MDIIRKQLKDFILSVGADNLINNPTPKEKQAFEGLLFTRGMPNVSLIKALAAD